MILSIETSTPVCSVALQNSSGRIFEKRTEGRGVHSERTFLFIQELLERTDTDISDLNAVLFSNGPGSYTGLRIGASALKGILFGREVPFYTYPTLISFAAGVGSVNKNAARIFSVIDARRNHLYVQQVDRDSSGFSANGEPSVKTLEEISESLQHGDILAGTGWERLSLPDKKQIETYGSNIISAKNLILAWKDDSLKKYFKKEDPAAFEPNYLNMAQVNNSSV